MGGALGVTSHSFGGSVGVYYKALHATPWATSPLPEQPEEPTCQARRFLRKSIFQLRCLRPEIWYVDRKGSNLDRVMSNVRKALEKQALPWLEALRDPEAALRAFESRSGREMLRGIMLEDFGGMRDSFARAEATSALALACGQPQRARDAWLRMLANPFYERTTPTRLEAERRLALI